MTTTTKQLRRIAMTAILATLASVFALAAPASAQTGNCLWPASDDDGDGIGDEFGRDCSVDWTVCTLPQSFTPKQFNTSAGFDNFDPLHWHFGRVANLTAEPLGMLLNANGDVETEFDNFDDLLSPTTFRDEAGTEWILQAPTKSVFHQPPERSRNWEPLPFFIGEILGLANVDARRPVREADYPMRKFVTRPTASGYSFELILQPDDLTEFPYTYDEQKVLPGDLGGTFNYADADFSALFHSVWDVNTHTQDWFGIYTTRIGGQYNQLDQANAISPKPWEVPGRFLQRSENIVNNLDEIRRAARGDYGFFDPRVTHKLQRATDVNGQLTYMLRPSNGGDFFNPVIEVRSELNHVVEAYFDYRNQDARTCG